MSCWIGGIERPRAIYGHQATMGFAAIFLISNKNTRMILNIRLAIVTSDGKLFTDGQHTWLRLGTIPSKKVRGKC